MNNPCPHESAPPQVSVCIPTYRGEKHLAATIDSVLMQTFADFELLIVDDNSPDETESVVSHFSDKRIRYLRNPVNLGPEGNWNRCLEESRGRYFKLLPQDDTLIADALDRQVQVLEKDNSERIALVFGSRRIIDSDGRVMATRGYPGGKDGGIDAITLVRRCVRYGTNLIGEPGTVLFRKSLADKVGMFDASIPYIIDLDYWARLLAFGKAHYLSHPVATFRVSPGSWSVAIGTRQSDQYQSFMSKLSKQGHWDIRPMDILAGNAMARLNNLMRLVFYKVALRG
jgi:glycosyltransferase involved in cell wall biosynthesis